VESQEKKKKEKYEKWNDQRKGRVGRGEDIKGGGRRMASWGGGKGRRQKINREEGISPLSSLKKGEKDRLHQ